MRVLAYVRYNHYYNLHMHRLKATILVVAWDRYSDGEHALQEQNRKGVGPHDYCLLRLNEGAPARLDEISAEKGRGEGAI